MACQRHSLVTARRLAYYFDVVRGLQEAPQSITEERVIVDNQHTHVHAMDSTLSNGRFASRHVPPPSRVRIRKLPPSSSARSRIEASPTPRRTVSDMPVPSSSIERWSTASLTWSRMVHSDACA